MKKSEVVIGEEYIAKVSGRIATVKITGASPDGGWRGVNVATGREIRIRSASRLRGFARSKLDAYLGPTIPPTDLTSPRKAPAERGIRIGYISEWRKKQHDARRTSTMEAFWLEHGLCPICRGKGKKANAWPQKGYVECTGCEGKGLIDETENHA